MAGHDVEDNLGACDDVSSRVAAAGVADLSLTGSCDQLTRPGTAGARGSARARATARAAGPPGRR